MLIDIRDINSSSNAIFSVRFSGSLIHAAPLAKTNSPLNNKKIYLNQEITTSNKNCVKIVQKRNNFTYFSSNGKV